MYGNKGARGYSSLRGISPHRGRGRGGGRGPDISRGGRGFRRGRGMTYPTVKLKLTHKGKCINVEAPANTTFGDLKVLASQDTGIPPEGIAFLFRGRKKADNEVLSLAGVKSGCEVKILETEGYREQKAAQQAAQQPEEPAFLAFSEEDAAAARAAAAQEAAQHKSRVSVRDQALTSIQGISQQVDGLEQQAKEVMQQQQDAGTGSKAAAGLIEALTQKLLSLDNVQVDGDQEVRQKRKAEINRINQLCDSLETHRTKQ